MKKTNTLLVLTLFLMFNVDAVGQQGNTDVTKGKLRSSYEVEVGCHKANDNDNQADIMKPFEGFSPIDAGVIYGPSYAFQTFTSLPGQK